MDEAQPSAVRTALRALVRLGLGIAIFAVLAPAPASSGPLLDKCPSVRAISV